MINAFNTYTPEVEAKPTKNKGLENLKFEVERQRNYDKIQKILIDHGFDLQFDESHQTEVFIHIPSKVFNELIQVLDHLYSQKEFEASKQEDEEKINTLVLLIEQIKDGKIKVGGISLIFTNKKEQ